MAHNESNITGNLSGTISPKPHFKASFSVPSFLFLLFILIMSLSGNILVLLAFKLYRKLRTKTNYFVVSLALADILVASFSMPLWAAYLLTGPDWIYPMTLMRIWTSVDILCGVASIINLAAISIERCICITYPLTYHITMTSRRAIKIIIINWIVATIVSAVKFVWGNDIPRPYYELLITISCFFIPLIIMCLSYHLIFKAARYQARQIALVVKGGVRNFLLSTEVRAAKTLAVVMGTFIISWAPFFIINLVYGFSENEDCCHPTIVMVVKWMHYSNSFYNPVVYACMNKEFRAAFANILFRRLCGKGDRRYSRTSCTHTEFLSNGLTKS